MLYNISQSENTRNGKLTMSVGTAREKDIIAVLSHGLGGDLVHDIADCKPEDLRYKDELISVKHVSGKTKTPPKVSWTVDNNKVVNTKVEFLSPSKKHCHILYTQVAPPVIIITMITGQAVKEVLLKFGEKAFKVNTGTNNRGIEFTTTAFKELLARAVFTVTIHNVAFDYKCPIKHRKQLLGRV